MKTGSIISLLILPPNIVWMFFNRKNDKNSCGKVARIIEVFENVGRFSTLAIPFFYDLNFAERYSCPVMVLMVICLLIYYACWARYFMNGRSSLFFKKPFIYIPLPMALMPVAFFALSSYLVNSWIMLAASILFGIFHIFVSIRTLS